MVLRCPECSELAFYGRTQVLGELVVCPRCDAVFGWCDARQPGAGAPTKGAARPDAPGPEGNS